MHTRLRRYLIALVTVTALLGVSATVSPTAGAKVAKKKTTKKKTTKKKVTTTTTKATQRVVTGPTGATTQTVTRRPADVDPNGEIAGGYAAPPTILDPAKNSFYPFTSQLYDRLTQVTDDLIVKPMLATGWSFPSKSILEMTLRDDVTFEDGTRFDATAVKANIERMKTLPGSLQAGSLKGISSVQVVSPTVVRFNLSAGGAELPSVFSSAAGMMISPKVIASGVSIDLSTRGGGSGPYTVDVLSPNDKIVYKQSKMVQDGTYWDKAAGLLKKLTWQFVPTSAQRINAVRSGDLDLAQVTGSDAAVGESMVRSGQIRGRIQPLWLTQAAVFLRTTRPPFDNKLFRDAVQLAVDKVAFTKGVYGGTCDPVEQAYPASHWAHSNATDAIYDYDRDKAQKMIKDSGIFNPSFTLQYASLYEAPAQALAGVLGDYGINVKLAPTPTTDTTFRDGQADAIYTAITAPVDPAGLMSTLYLGIYNLYNDSDGSVARDAAAASDPTISQAQAKVIYDRIFQKVVASGAVLHICNAHHVWVHAAKLANVGDLRQAWAGLIDARFLYVKK